MTFAKQGGVAVVYDTTNSRNKWLSVAREKMIFVGRDNANNSNEYARIATFTSNNTGNRLLRNATLLGIAAHAAASGTWTVRVRKNGTTTNLASLTLTSTTGTQVTTLNVDFDAGDQVQVFIEGTGVDRPVIKLDFADRY